LAVPGASSKSTDIAKFPPAFKSFLRLDALGGELMCQVGSARTPSIEFFCPSTHY
jgi:hypothetical protein